MHYTRLTNRHLMIAIEIQGSSSTQSLRLESVTRALLAAIGLKCGICSAAVGGGRRLLGSSLLSRAGQRRP